MPHKLPLARRWLMDAQSGKEDLAPPRYRVRCERTHSFSGEAWRGKLPLARRGTKDAHSGKEALRAERSSPPRFASSTAARAGFRADPAEFPAIPAGIGKRRPKTRCKT